MLNENVQQFQGMPSGKPFETGGPHSSRNSQSALANMAAIGVNSLVELSDILKAIRGLAIGSGDPVIQGIATIGIKLSAEAQNLMDCESESFSSAVSTQSKFQDRTIVSQESLQ